MGTAPPGSTADNASLTPGDRAEAVGDGENYVIGVDGGGVMKVADYMKMMGEVKVESWDMADGRVTWLSPDVALEITAGRHPVVARNLARAGLIVSGAFLVSRLLGWVRVVVIGKPHGAKHARREGP